MSGCRVRSIDVRLSPPRWAIRLNHVTRCPSPTDTDHVRPPSSAVTRRPRLHRLPRLGVTARLLLLVFVPLLGLLTLSLSIAHDKRDTADMAATVDRDVERISRITAVRAALFRERVHTELAGAFTTLGLDPKLALQFIGYDVIQSQADNLIESDQALAALGDERILSAAQVRAAREASQPHPITEGTPPDWPLTKAFVPLEQRLDEATARVRGEVRPHLDIAGGSQVTEGLVAVRDPLKVVAAMTDQLTAVGSVYFDVGDRAQHLRAIQAARLRETDAFADLSELADADMGAAATALRDHPDTAAYWRNVDSIAAGDAPRYVNGPVDWMKLGELEKLSLPYADRTFALIRTSTEGLRATAAQAQSDAIDELQRWSAFSAGLVVLSVFVSLGLARSISRPLSRLADHAAAVSSGELDVDDLPARGPTDIAVTSQAFNDLVGNLRLLDAKAEALGDLDFEAPVLSQPLPGRLGRSLQRSFSALSGSIEERDALRSRVLHQAMHDAVTGLHNRAAATEAIEQALARARRTERGVAILTVDVDDFKRTNDTHGATVGDEVLREVGKRILAAADGASMVARVGGDDFVVLAEDVEDPDDVIQLARQVTALVNRPLSIGPGNLALSVSVGVSFSWDGDAADQLLAWADLALTRAKFRGAGSIEVYDRGLQEQMQEQAAIEEALTTGLADDELFLQYQPVIDLATGATTSVEALVRWQRPGQGMQPPDSFIPVAERSALIIDLDRWVMNRAARQLGAWVTDPNLSHIDVAVNVSGRHLASQRLHDHVIELLDATGIDPRRLIVEITETVLVDDLHLAAAQLEAIRALGVRIALDDFGTGYTSIAHLQRLPIDIIKIDRSFVARLGGDRDRALLAMITTLGHQLGMTIVAEGIETPEQYQLLRDLGCDRAQGFLMSRPLDPERLESWAGVPGGWAAAAAPTG
jgi:diguanylate cyclase (GGDEF)-like protein